MERLLAFVEVKKTVGFSETTIRQWVKEGKFPRPICVNGGSKYRWLQSEIVAWLDEQIVQSRGA